MELGDDLPPQPNLQLENIPEIVPPEERGADGETGSLPDIGRSTCSNNSVGGRSVNSDGNRSAKRRTWKKPKDKPKRPLSAYNIFFKHERQRIVDNKTEEPTPEEVVRSIEGILATSRETRRHRKTHGKISFGDLARQIADRWKNISRENKAVFEHYADLDMRRYRKNVQAWKERKENEAFSAARQAVMAQSDHVSSMHSSMSSIDSQSSDYSFDQLPADPFAPRRNFYDSSSFSSSSSTFSDPVQIGMMAQANAQQQQMMMQQQQQPGSNMQGGGAQSSSDGPFQIPSFETLQQQKFELQQQLQQLEQQQQQIQQQMMLPTPQQQYSMDQFGQQSLTNLGDMNNNDDNDGQDPNFHNSIAEKFVGNHLDPVPFEQVFPDDKDDEFDGSKDLEGFLSNLDLSEGN